MSKTTKIEVLKEEIEKSEHAANFLCDDLRAVLNNSNSVQAIIVLDLIKEANEIRIKIKNLQDAIITDEIIAAQAEDKALKDEQEKDRAIQTYNLL